MLSFVLAMSLLPTVGAAEPVQSPAEREYVAGVRLGQLSLRRTIESRWRVVDGQGTTIDIQDWATLTGDRAPFERAATADARAKAWGWRLAGVGFLGLGALALAPIGQLSHGIGEARWKERMTDQDAAVAAASVLGAAGLGCVVVSFSEPAVPKRLRSPVRLWVPAERVDALITVFNTQLREDLTAGAAPAEEPAAVEPTEPTPH